MSYDVSVLIPAFEAEPFLARAIASLRRQDGVAIQAVIAADDDADYLALLAREGIPLDGIVQVRTSRPASGPGLARNAALAAATAPLLATLDADDEYAPGRLAPLLQAARRHGVATGPTVELTGGSETRRGEAPAGADEMTLTELCGLRLPFAPVFRRELAGDGWPDLCHAEDLMFNIELLLAAGGYGFVGGAIYYYHRRQGSLSDSGESLDRSERGYLQILDRLPGLDWPEDFRRTVQEVIAADLEMVRQSRAAGKQQSWRDAWNAWSAGEHLAAKKL
jgi:succinoglycan biosynthesis protein ExoO